MVNLEVLYRYLNNLKSGNDYYVIMDGLIQLNTIPQEDLIRELFLQGRRAEINSNLIDERKETIEKLQSQIKKLKASAKKAPAKKSKK